MKLTINQLRQIIKEEVQSVIFESSLLSEATREPDNMVRDLKRLPIGGRLPTIRLGDSGDREAIIEKRMIGRQRKYVLIMLGRTGKPKSEEIFDTAVQIAHSIGRFAY
jgi:hypothetical protein